MDRIISEKRSEFAVEARGLLKNFREDLGVSRLENVRLLNVYYMDCHTSEELEASLSTVFSEPSVDTVKVGDFDIPNDARVFGMRFLPGQYDQRADSAEQAVRILTGSEVSVRSMKVFILEGEISDDEFSEIKRYMINPTDSEEAPLTMPSSFKDMSVSREKTEVFTGFRTLDGEELKNFSDRQSLAMSFEDLKLIQKYYANEEDRDPTEAEIKIFDTYWSDHCRHTTFETVLTNLKFYGASPLADSFTEYISLRDEVYADKQRPISLMDMATIAAKAHRKRGLLEDQEISGEINACSVEIETEHRGEKEPWLMMFKNETHNHPTEIEPFGGAATCLGGAIRDPLSGRSYVYQAMRISGAADPTVPVSKTRQGKIPQLKLTRTAAAGYSSYGNQIGIATGYVREYYHPGYEAKRLELGAVIGAVRKDMVRREEPSPTDVVLLLGGKTGRDGLGGAVGSSKKQTESSIETSGAEVQKGNAPEERKILRLFRNPDATKLIKKCNDFGAGGVSVAIGELARGLDIDLEAVPLKYSGITATEIAISESQERMAVVVSKEDCEKFISLANEENLSAVKVAHVTDSERLRMTYKREVICDISRKFLDTNGAKNTQTADLSFSVPNKYFVGKSGDIKTRWFNAISDLNAASQKGLKERFDFSVGAGTVLAPLGGKYQLTEEVGMVSKIPVIDGETRTCSVMAAGFYPYLGELSTYHSAVFAVADSVAKLACYGADLSRIRLSFQEYFGKLKDNPKKWGEVSAALLGALTAQMSLGTPSIGGKDSMSGTFEDLDVPPTFVSFAASTSELSKITTASLQGGGSSLYLLETNLNEFLLPDFDLLKRNLKLISDGKFKSVSTVRSGGIAETLSNMAFGNMVGFSLDISEEKLFIPMVGSFIVESDEDLGEGFIKIGETSDDGIIHYKDLNISLEELKKIWETPLEGVFLSKENEDKREVKTLSYDKKVFIKGESFAKPKVLITAFSGTNSEYDSKNAFDRAGAQTEIFLFKNRTASDIEQSVKKLSEKIKSSQIVMIPGGFSAGDEPEGSAKFIATCFRNPGIKEALNYQFNEKKGLILGICNGFQTLIKLGLLPYGKISALDENSPTLTYNSIGHHQAVMVNVRISSNISPWYAKMNLGEVYKMPISHGEGRFISNDLLMKELIADGQIASQYVDFDDNATMDINFNPNGSLMAVEALTDKTGRILGKMGHSERITYGTYKNIPNVEPQPIFLGGVEYFS